MTRSFAILLLFASLSLAALASAQDHPTRPANGLRDDTRALPAQRQAELAGEIAACRAALQADVWLNAGTFLPSGQTLRSQARDLRQHWSPDRDAILLAYDRASDSLALSLSPSLWERYPTAEISALSPRVATLMAAKEQPLDQRLAASLRLVMTQMQHLEKERGTAETTLSADHDRIARIFAVTLASGALVLALLGTFMRRRDVQAAWQLHFPDVQVGLRFGAAHGGGILAEKDRG
jgi:hypothetical protein